MQFESANQKKNKFLAVTRATGDVIQKKPRSSGDENASGHVDYRCQKKCGYPVS